ncbi:MAG: hypothetical protein AAB388_00025 [Patescibacteria group bacterium]
MKKYSTQRRGQKRVDAEHPEPPRTAHRLEGVVKNRGIKNKKKPKTSKKRKSPRR